ncbi:MAG: hypothetical protein JNG86_09760 [Verrucomicrobiaceae bacterium]|nr:hypothetical protein [Verrucomicrobiaceae bacterium]
MVATIGLGACVFVDRDPQPGQALGVEKAGWSRFAGVYRLRAVPEKMGQREDWVILRSFQRQVGDVLRLTPEKNGLAIRYEGRDGSAQSGRLDFRSPEVRFQNGRIVFQPSPQKGGAILPGPQFSAGTSCTLYFAEGGDLIVMTDNWETAAPLLVLPFHESRRRVYRLERVR